MGKDEIQIKSDRSEQDDEIIESGGVHYVRNQRHGKTFSEIEVDIKQKDDFRSGSIKQAVKKIFKGK